MSQTILTNLKYDIYIFTRQNIYTTLKTILYKPTRLYKMTLQSTPYMSNIVSTIISPRGS